MSPRVALVVEQLRRRVPGGVGRVATSLLDTLAAMPSAADVTLVASRAPGGGRADPLRRWGLPLATSAVPGPLLTRAWDHRLLSLARSYDVVHGISMAVPPKSPSSGALVVTVHDLAWRRFPEATTPRGRRWHEAALGRVLVGADAVVVPSEAVADELAAGARTTPPVTVIPWGADHLPPADHAAADRLLALVALDGPFLLTVSTLEPRKNLDRLVEAYGRARGAFPEPWPLVVAGPAGWGRRLGPPPKGVVLLGPVHDGVLAALYERARSFAYVPLAEGYGFPPVEAMAAGLPVVASMGVPSVAVPAAAGGTGPALLVDPFSIEDIAAALVRVSTEDALREQLARSGRALARTRTWSAAAVRHLELWRALS